VMEVGWRVFDAAQRKRLYWPVSGGHHAVHHAWVVEPLDLKIVHGVVGVVRRRMAGRALRLAEEEILAAHLLCRGLGWIELAIDSKLGCRREVENLLELGHEVYLTAAFE